MQQVPSDRYWAKVLFKEFIRHYRRMTDEQAAADVKQSMLDLEDLNPDGESFGSKMVRWSIERKDSKTAVASRENGKKGGRPRKNPESSTSENIYDQVTTTMQAAMPAVSTNDGWRTGGPSLSKTSSLPPVRLSSTDKTGDVLSMAYSGEFSNVILTQEQYNELGIKFGNLQKLNRAIDSLSCKLENDEITPKPRNHYAVLVKWATYRDDKEEEAENAQPKQRYMTSAEISERNALIGWKKLKESQARRAAK